MNKIPEFTIIIRISKGNYFSQVLQVLECEYSFKIRSEIETNYIKEMENIEVNTTTIQVHL